MSYADYGNGPEAPVSNPREIVELFPFSSLQFTVQSSDEDKEPESPRFGLPIYYTLRRDNARQTKLHFSRVIHGATRLLDHPHKGMSVLEPVYDDLTVLRNIRWGLGQTLFRYGSGFPDVEVKGKIVEHAFWMQKEGYAESYAESTITRRTRLLRTITNKGANLQDPESVKEILARQQKWQAKTKKIAVETYSLFLKMQGKTWSPPKYLSTRRLPFIPLEREIDDLIAGCNPKTATFLRMLKETGARLGEAWQLQWIDIDFENKTVNITPEKGSNPRKLKLTDKLLSMLNNLPKTQPQIFIGSQRHFVRAFRRQRKKVALKLENDRITKISCHTFRHWKATTEIARHRTIKEVQYMLGHRSLLSTDYYVQVVTFESDDYTSANARTIKEAQKLVEAGFEYVCDFDGDKLFRKRK